MREVILLESSARPLAADSFHAHVLHFDYVPGLAAPRGALQPVASLQTAFIFKFFLKRSPQRQLRELLGCLRETCLRVQRSLWHSAVLQREALADGGTQSRNEPRAYRTT